MDKRMASSDGRSDMGGNGITGEIAAAVGADKGTGKMDNQTACDDS